jgi:hypothetical protein
MSDEEFKALQATFPWTHVVHPSGLGGHVRVLNRHGQEVPIFDMIAFLELITRKLEPKESPNAQG